MISMVYSSEYIKHETGDHPENMERLHVIIESLEKKGILNEINVSKPQIAKYEDILRVHTASYINSLRSFCRKGGGYLDFDTFASTETYKTAKLAAGGAIKASKLVLDGCNVAYSVARPPGHHATQDRAGGFCFFNNLAVALEYLRRVHGLKKFFVFDFDVHYGNGTAETFYEDPDVLYVSIHQDPSTIFPGKGFIEEIGKGAGEGYNLNIPMPPGSGDSDYMFMLNGILEPVAREFGADFYLVDVGFDGHMDDPFSRIQLTDDFYPWIARKMLDIAGSMVLILEGGYNLGALSRCNVKLINGLRDQLTSNTSQKQVDLDVSRGTDVSENISPETRNIFKNIKDLFSPFFEF